MPGGGGGACVGNASVCVGAKRGFSEMGAWLHSMMLQTLFAHPHGVVEVRRLRARRRRRRLRGTCLGVACGWGLGIAACSMGAAHRRGRHREQPRGLLGVARLEVRVHVRARAEARGNQDAPALALAVDERARILCAWGWDSGEWMELSLWNWPVLTCRPVHVHVARVGVGAGSPERNDPLRRQGWCVSMWIPCK